MEYSQILLNVTLPVLKILELKLNSIWQMYIFSSPYIKTTHNRQF